MEKECNIIYCFVCGKVHRKRHRSSYHFVDNGTTPDLDGRRYLSIDKPRGTYPYMECDQCGYISRELDDELDLSREFFSSTAYQTCDGLALKSEKAIIHYRIMLAMIACGCMESGFYYACQVAWNCDDADDVSNAIHCRRIVYECYQKTDRLFKYRKLIIMMDIARRASLDSVVQELYQLVPDNQPAHKLIADFILKKTLDDNRKSINVRTVDGIKFKYWTEFN